MGYASSVIIIFSEVGFFGFLKATKTWTQFNCLWKVTRLPIRIKCDWVLLPHWQSGQKKKIVVLPSREISKYRSVSWKIFLKSTQKYQISVYYPPFFSKRWKNTQSAFPTLAFIILFFEMGRSLRATQDFFSWPHVSEGTLQNNST